MVCVFKFILLHASMYRCIKCDLIADFQEKDVYKISKDGSSKPKDSLKETILKQAQHLEACPHSKWTKLVLLFI